MPTQAQKRFRRLSMRDLQIACEADPDWGTFGPSEKLRRRMSDFSSFELNEIALYSNSRSGQVRRRLKAISDRARDGWISDFATLLLIAFQATLHINDIARRDPAYAKKFAFVLNRWPLLCKNRAKLRASQLELLDAIGIAKPNEFRVGSSQARSGKGAVSKEAEFIFLWMQDHWRQRQMLGEQSGSGIVMLFSGEQIWPRWYLKQRNELSQRLNAIRRSRHFKKISRTLKKVHQLPPSTEPCNHRAWTELAVQIYAEFIDAGIRLTHDRTGNLEGNASEERNKLRKLFKKNFLPLLSGKPGAGRPRENRA